MPVQKRFVGTARRDNRGVSLRKWRRWFDGEDGEGQDSNSTPATPEEKDKLIAALRKRLGERDATIDQLKQNSSSQADRLKAIEDAQRKQLEEQGNYSELAKQRAAEIEALKPKAMLADDAAEFLRNLNEQTIAGIPESYRKVVPDFGDSYEAQKRKAAWLRENLSFLTKPPAPDFDAGAGSNGGGSGKGNQTVQLTAEEKEMARQMRMSEEAYAKQKQAIAERKQQK